MIASISTITSYHSVNYLLSSDMNLFEYYLMNMNLSSHSMSESISYNYQSISYNSHSLAYNSHSLFELLLTGTLSLSVFIFMIV